VIRFGLAVLVLASGVAPTTPVLTVVSERTIPLKVPTDVRWLDDDHVLVADADRGLASVSLSGTSEPVTWLPEWPAPTAPGLRYFHLAGANGTVVASDFAFGLRWRNSGAAAVHRMIVEYIADVDFDGDRLLLSGLRRDAKGTLGADGATAWIGRLNAGDDGLKPVLPFKNRGTIENCAGFGLGAVRFLRDGSFVIVPGAEDGIYLYKKDGRLARTWQTDQFGLDAGCDFTRDQQTVLATKWVARQQWVNRRAIVDDIIETPGGPALIVRDAVAAGRTAWHLLLLDDHPSELPLPVTSPSPWAHVSAATRGNTLILLMGDRLGAQADGAPSRLIRLRWH
jgi:hypothetical protein